MGQGGTRKALSSEEMTMATMTTQERDAIVEHLRASNAALTPFEKLIRRGWIGIDSQGDVHTIRLMKAGQEALESFLWEQEEMEEATKGNVPRTDIRPPWKGPTK
jgi:hypothetical protein